eukprot:scaffold16559_cov51-Isochrysis_galbana.AAC.1
MWLRRSVEGVGGVCVLRTECAGHPAAKRPPPAATPHLEWRMPQLLQLIVPPIPLGTKRRRRQRLPAHALELAHQLGLLGPGGYV